MKNRKSLLEKLYQGFVLLINMTGKVVFSLNDDSLEETQRIVDYLISRGIIVIDKYEMYSHVEISFDHIKEGDEDIYLSTYHKWDNDSDHCVLCDEVMLNNLLPKPKIVVTFDDIKKSVLNSHFLKGKEISNEIVDKYVHRIMNKINETIMNQVNYWDEEFEDIKEEMTEVI